MGPFSITFGSSEKLGYLFESQIKKLAVQPLEVTKENCNDNCLRLDLISITNPFRLTNEQRPYIQFVSSNMFPSRLSGSHYIIYYMLYNKK